MQKGWFLAANYIPTPSDAEVHLIRLDGAAGEAIAQPPEYGMITRITDRNTKMKVYATKDGIKGDEVVYDFTELNLHPAKE